MITSPWWCTWYQMHEINKWWGIHENQFWCIGRSHLHIWSYEIHVNTLRSELNGWPVIFNCLSLPWWCHSKWPVGSRETLQWCHHGHDGVSNNRHLNCLIKENIKAPRHWHLWGEFPAQRASKAENVSISWHHDLMALGLLKTPGTWFSIKMSSYQYRKSHCDIRWS